MQQRQLRLGDILDDYCPRERRVTNHAVVAMIAEEVRQTRCTTCDAEHEYKQARVPPQRRRKVVEPPDPNPVAAPSTRVVRAVSPARDATAADRGAPAHQPAVSAKPEPALPSVDPETPVEEPAAAEGPVHRQLIRATLPRPEGQVPERRLPEFTIRQTPGGGGGRFRQTPGGGGRGGPERHRPHGGQASRHAGGRPHQRPFSSRPSRQAPVARPGKKRSK